MSKPTRFANRFCAGHWFGAGKLPYGAGGLLVRVALWHALAYRSGLSLAICGRQPGYPGIAHQCRPAAFGGPRSRAGPVGAKDGKKATQRRCNRLVQNRRICQFRAAWFTPLLRGLFLRFDTFSPRVGDSERSILPGELTPSNFGDSRFVSIVE